MAATADPLARPEPGPNKRLALIGAARDILELHGGSLVQAALRQGCQVLCIAPGFPSGHASDGRLAGAILDSFDADPEKAKTFSSAAARRSLAASLQAFAPDVVVACGLTSLAALGSRSRQASSQLTACQLLAGDDEAMPAGLWTPRAWLSRSRLGRSRMPAMLKAVDVVLLSDHDIRDALQRHRQAGTGPKLFMTPGRGCESDQLGDHPLPALEKGLTFTLLDEGHDAAMLDAFERAAAELKPRSQLSRFIVAREATYATGPKAEGDGDAPVEYRTFQPGREIDAIIPSHVIVQGRPSTPYGFAFLTAMAAGRPVIARDTPAMREAVDEVVNGILVDPEAADTLTKAIASLLRRPDLLVSMARASRAKAQRKFDARVVDSAILTELGVM